MCFRKNKKNKLQPSPNAKFSVGDFVAFRYNNELSQGKIRLAYLLDNGETAYQIQVGGECGFYASKILENEIVSLIKKSQK